MNSSAWVKQYLRHGERRARMSAAWALPRLAPSVAARLTTGAGLLGSVSSVGATTGLSFDEAHYRAQCSNGLMIRDAALHYLLVGSQRGLSPSPLFDAATYRAANPDVHVAGYLPFAHARWFGAVERRIPGSADATQEPPVPSLTAVSALPPLPAPGGDGTVNVIVPVYRGLDNMLRTIGAVLTARDPHPHDIVVVDDATPEADTRAAMVALADARLIRLVTVEHNGGFVRAVNAGMAVEPTRAVVLLNSDTAVYGPWLSRMMQVMGKHADAGTVTPLSNAATILSYPIWLRDTALWPDLPAAEIDAAAEALDLPAQEIPTGVGFCMAISARARAALGPLDAEAFGQGYGEENDYCRRAVRAGLTNLVACNTFVWHQGGGTFGPEKAARVDAAQQTLERMHLGYRHLVHSYIKRNPLAEVRARLDLERLRRAPRRKVLTTNAAVEVRDGDLEIRIVRDIGRFAGQFRLVPVGAAPHPNLPRVTARTSPSALKELLHRAGIKDVTASAKALLPGLTG